MAGPLNNNGWKNKRLVKGLQMFAADFMGNAADLMFLRYQESFDKAVPFVKTTFKSVMYLPTKILQSPIEWALGKFSGIEGADARDERMHQSEEKRLDNLLETGYHYLSAGLVGYTALINTEKYLSKVMNTSHVPNKMWWRLDFPVHLGAALVLGSKTASPVTGTIKDMLKKVMVGVGGWDEKKAEQDARFTIAYILPNYLTLIPTVGMMGGLYRAQEKGLVRATEKTSWLQKASHGKLGDETHAFEEVTKGSIPKDPTTMTGWAKILNILEEPSKSKTAAH